MVFFFSSVCAIVFGYFSSNCGFSCSSLETAFEAEIFPSILFFWQLTSRDDNWFSDHFQENCVHARAINLKSWPIRPTQMRNFNNLWHLSDRTIKLREIIHLYLENHHPPTWWRRITLCVWYGIWVASNVIANFQFRVKVSQHFVFSWNWHFNRYRFMLNWHFDWHYDTTMFYKPDWICKY